MNAFNGLIKLEQLYLAANPLLNEIHAKAFGNENKLKRLDLAANQLNQIDSKLIDWKRLEWLDLSGNRWDCNCQLLSFLPKILRKLNNSGTLCNMPETLFNANLKDIKVRSIFKVYIFQKIFF